MRARSTYPEGTITSRSATRSTSRAFWRSCPSGREAAVSRTFEGAQRNRLVASEMGVGRPVLLLHGGGQTRHAWSRTARRLAEAGWHAVALDQRGHGDSAWVADGAYAFRDFAADAAAVAQQIAQEQGRRPVAIGASLGGI